MKNLSFTFLLLSSLLITTLKAEIPQTEKDALLAISESLNYPNNWTEDTPFEEWNGILISEVDGEEHVTSFTGGISLHNSLEDINFSSQIQNLTNLTNFQFLVSGEFNSNLNFDFQHLTNLDDLEIIFIRLPNTQNGDYYHLLNTDQIAEIENLKSFTIRFNNPDFTLPENFSNLSNLKYLEYTNIYGYFPDYIYGLSDLEELYVRVKIDYDFPSHIDNLSDLNNLKILTITDNPYYNFFNGNLPAVFYNLPSIEKLSLLFHEAEYLEISDDISNYNNQLKYFSLAINSTFNLSPNLWNLNFLESLILESNSSLHLSEQVQNLQNLKSLKLISDGQLSIPNTIKNMTNLETLVLYSQIYNEYPDEIYQTPNLKAFGISIFDEVPEQITSFPSIEHVQLNLVDNYLQAFPEFLGNMPNLKKLDILNDFDGDINNHLFTLPDSYFSQPNLEQFWTVLKVDADITNKFINSPNLKTLAFESLNGQNLRGFLNLCNNPKLETLGIYKSDIHKIDLRNNETFTNGNFGFMRFDNNSITDFYVDDVNVFNQLIDEKRVTINYNSDNYQVSTSNDSCHRTMNTADVSEENLNIYPNPTRDFINFKSGQNISDIKITSLDGKTFEVYFSNGKANVSHLPKGIYLLQYQANGIHRLEKFIKK